MKKRLLFLSCFALLGFTGYAQVGVGTPTPDPSAQLEVQSANKGLLIPRVNSTGDVASPAKGLLVYQTSGTEGFYYNSGTSVTPVWVLLSGGATGAAGGALAGTYPNPTLANGSVANATIADNAVTTPKIQDGVVTPAKISSSGATAGQVLTYNGTNVVWSTPSGGSSGSGAIIPFSSGSPVQLVTLIGGLAGQSAALGFGAATTVTPLNGSIDLAGVPNYAFSVPRSGTITDLAAYFSLSTSIVLPFGTSISVTAQLYQSAASDNIFTPIPNTLVTLSPTLTDLVPLGTSLNGLTNGVNIPVTAGTRLLLVLSANTSGGSFAPVLTGSASAGLSIN